MRRLKIHTSVTNRESDGLQKYLQEIAKHEMISPDEEVALSLRIKSGDTKAIEILTKANLRFVVSVAKQYQNQGLSLSDLINEGNLGLIKAAGRFDESKGFKFISYAVWWIRQSILHALANQSRLVRVPFSKNGLNVRVTRAMAQLEQKNERQPTPEELAEFLDEDLESIESLFLATQRHVSVDSPLSSEEEGTLLETLVNTNAEKADQQITYREGLKLEIDRTLSILPQRQKDILCLFYGIGTDEPWTLDELANRYNLTCERVRQIRDKGLLKLRGTGNMAILREYI